MDRHYTKGLFPSLYTDIPPEQALPVYLVSNKSLHGGGGLGTEVAT